MKTFIFRYKLPTQWFWRKVKVVGFKLHEGRMILYKTNGGVFEIPEWKNNVCSLGEDWVLFTKDNMEREAGQGIKVNLVSK